MYTENYWLQIKREQEAYEDSREIQKAAAKATAVENVKIQARQLKMQLKEAEAERKKSQIDELCITREGDLVIQTKNLSVAAIPRIAANFRYPRLTLLRRLNNPDEEIFRIDFTIGERERKFYIRAEDAGSGAKLMRKFTGAGGYFHMPQSKAKQFATQLFCVLRQISTEEKMLADEPGWLIEADGQCKYIGEEEETWKKVLKKS